MPKLNDDDRAGSRHADSARWNSVRCIFDMEYNRASERAAPERAARGIEVLRRDAALDETRSPRRERRELLVSRTTTPGACPTSAPRST